MSFNCLCCAEKKALQTKKDQLYRILNSKTRQYTLHFFQLEVELGNFDTFVEFELEKRKFRELELAKIG